MERADRAELIRLPGVLVQARLEAGQSLPLDDETAHHLRVRRLAAGSVLRVTDGAGSLGRAVLTELDRRRATIALEWVVSEPPPPPVRLLVPVADRDRTLWLAEKAVELSLARWTPVSWRRSKDVSPRGEGDSFRSRLHARMASALVQCGGAWLPEVDAEEDASSVLATLGSEEALRLLLDPSGPPMLDGLGVDERRGSLAGGDGNLAVGSEAGVVIALGPEGGLLEGEVRELEAAGFRACSLGSRVLRFETAAVAALSVLLASREAAAPASPSA